MNYISLSYYLKKVAILVSNKVDFRTKRIIRFSATLHDDKKKLSPPGKYNNN